ncbi:uncharacterized protein LOC127925198 isoform X21 [Oncorhynchus keta]|uniref:uncharacterized protein LOC127925198 isoform X21 n=1 Tax=Oncorhynchus keta TaxID=8018 RepID=UPI00227C55F4|nr:uncharacterized protein LOC127925198 isoform X21 [Oncorhynchus keta]
MIFFFVPYMLFLSLFSLKAFLKQHFQLIFAALTLLIGTFYLVSGLRSRSVPGSLSTSSSLCLSSRFLIYFLPPLSQNLSQFQVPYLLPPSSVSESVSVPGSLSTSSLLCLRICLSSRFLIYFLPPLSQNLSQFQVPCLLPSSSVSESVSVPGSLSTSSSLCLRICLSSRFLIYFLPPLSQNLSQFQVPYLLPPSSVSESVSVPGSLSTSFLLCLRICLSSRFLIYFLPPLSQNLSQFQVPYLLPPSSVSESVSVPGSLSTSSLLCLRICLSSRFLIYFLPPLSQNLSQFQVPYLLPPSSVSESVSVPGSLSTSSLLCLRICLSSRFLIYFLPPLSQNLSQFQVPYLLPPSSVSESVSVPGSLSTSSLLCLRICLSSRFLIYFLPPLSQNLSQFQVPYLLPPSSVSESVSVPGSLSTSSLLCLRICLSSRFLIYFLPPLSQNLSQFQVPRLLPSSSFFSTWYESSRLPPSTFSF